MATEDATWDEGSSAVYDPEHPDPDTLGHLEDGLEGAGADDAVEDGATNNVDDDEEGGEYDPASVGLEVPTQVPDKSASATPSQRSTSKPKTAGGFVVEVSDDEDDGDATPSSAMHPNGAHSDPSGNEGTAAVVADAHAAAAGFPGVDPVALFEVRIQEDPRGDMDAWLGLHADQKSRNQLESLRALYNRFLEVFPQAVSLAARPSSRYH